MIINPEIVSVSDDVRKRLGRMPQHSGNPGACAETQVRTRGLQGQEQQSQVEDSFSDFEARVFQHEYDHINGVVFIDRVESPLEIITEKEYMKLMAEPDSE